MAEDKSSPDESGSTPEQDAQKAVDEAIEAARAAADAEAEEAADAPELDDDPLAQAEARVAELTDQLLRTQAEIENVRRRGQRDVENAHKYGSEKLVESLLPVLDSLEKAVEAADAAENDDAKAIGEGVVLSLKLAVDTLGKAGVEAVNPVGEPFDPNLHEAMAMVPSPDAEPNSVIDVLQTGYSLNGRLVRAARVVVSKAPD